MALEIEGRIAHKLNVQTGTSSRGAWSKQEFVIEYQDGNFPTQLCMNVWGDDKVKELDKYQVGDKVKVSFNLSSREYNGRWYTDVRAWRIEPSGLAQAAPVQETYGQQTGGYQAAPMPTINDLPGDDESDDLPF